MARRASTSAPPQDVDARADDLTAAALAGDRRALARVLTTVENRNPLAEPALRILYPKAGRAHVVGITGPPGAGKSTLVAALIGELRRAGRSVAVVAVDPSSPITGGALLGDRVRMQAYAEPIQDASFDVARQANHIACCRATAVDDGQRMLR